MRAFRTGAWILAASLLGLSACKDELDDKPIADPLDDPWVDAIDSGDESTAPAAAPTDPAEPEVEPLALAEPSEAPEPAPEGEPEPAAESGEARTGPAAPTAAANDPSEAPAAANSPPPGQASPDSVSPSATEPPAAEPAEPAESAEQPSPSAAAEQPSPAPAAKQPEPAPPALTIADFHGDYRFVGGSAQRRDLEEAIEEAADQLPGAFRGIGRRRLTKTNPIDGTLEIVIAGDKVTTIFESGFDATCEIDGPTVRWTSSKGDKYKVRVRKKGAKLVQIIQGDDGVKTTVFVLSSDKKRLTVHHKITADRLPEPMTYRLSYSRK